MPTMILVRHGRTTANADGILAGRAKGVHLDDVGREQAVRVAERLAVLPLAAVVSSPLERTRETAAAIAKAQPLRPRVRSDKSVVECGYGEWTGRSIKDLAKEPLWPTVQAYPSTVRFPDGESMREMQDRAVTGVRSWDARVREEHGADACFAVVSHGDVIKAILAEAMGMHLDLFQRLVVHPASVSVVQYADARPVVHHMNDGGVDLSVYAPRKDSADPAAGAGDSGDAVIGGGSTPA